MSQSRKSKEDAARKLEKRARNRAKKAIAKAATREGFTADFTGLNPADFRNAEVPFPCPGCRSMKRHLGNDSDERVAALRAELSLSATFNPKSPIAVCDACGRIAVIINDHLPPGAVAVEMARAPTGGWASSVHTLAG